MLGWLRNWLGTTAPKAPPINQRAVAELATHIAQKIQGRYDNALWTDENQRSWWQADYLSARSANNYQVRRQLRNRSRYETSNNPFLFGIVNDNADDVIASGPTLQCLLPSAADNRLVERRWYEWACEVDYAEKLRTLKLARTIDGEGFLILKTAPQLENPVQLFPLDVEADQVTAISVHNLEELWLDGVILDPVTGRPTAYHVLRTHPGDYFFPNLNPLAVERVPARWVIHWFKKFRPGMVRGVPIFASALDLFAELRAYRKATLQKAQLAANLSAVLETEMPPDATGGDTGTPWDKIPTDRGALVTLPFGSKLKQYDTGEPGTTYEMFQEKCLSEACRPLSYPLNLALGTSQKFNFSSSRLDIVNYRNQATNEREDCDRVANGRVFHAWFAEGRRIPGYFPDSVRRLPRVPHEWHWPGFEPLDPMVDAQADALRLSNGTQTQQEFWARRGKPWKDVFRQLALEREEVKRLGLVFGDPATRSVTEQVDPDKPEAPAPELQEAAA